MTEVTISTKYQVVIPKEVRRQLNLQVGQKMQVITKGNTITLVPAYPIKKMRGILQGMDTKIDRDEEERV